MNRAIKLIVPATSLAIFLIGCKTVPWSSDYSASTQPTTLPYRWPTSDPATMPSGVSVSGDDFDRLWDAADAVARDLLFVPDRQSRRTGTLQTEPMTSGQWFEPWRRELRTSASKTESSLATVRRTLTVQITRDPATGVYAAMPSVLIERYTRVEHRVTSSAQYRQVYDANKGSNILQLDENGLPIPTEYWYPVGNDPALERYVAAKMKSRLND